jgi:hypothetical protein
MSPVQEPRRKSGQVRGDAEEHRVLFFCCPQWLADDASIGVGADAERRQVATLGVR